MWLLSCLIYHQNQTWVQRWILLMETPLLSFTMKKSDTVNVLTHAKSGVITSTKLNKTKKVKEKHGDAMEGIALWDVFHRQDVAKLEEYLRNHTAEFRHTDCLSIEQI
ncbi:hypothetical protein Hanom_Chr01g00019951 [Helianthus anomalus]